MLATPMQQLRHLYFSDPGVREALRAPLDDEAFVRAALAVAERAGIPLAPDEVRAALAGGQREWIERWI